MKRKSQIAIEYLIIVGISLVAILAIVGVYTNYSGEIESTININQVNTIAQSIISTSETIYYQGSPSQYTLDISMPKGVKNITILSNELTFIVSTQSGLSDINYVATVPIDGNIVIYPGKRKIIITARDDLVWINGT